MEKVYLYRITNKIDGTSYFGQTNNVNKRWAGRCRRVRSKLPLRRNGYLHKAMKKHGIKNFIVEALGFCLSRNAANVAEIALIKYWNDRVKLYNLNPGGGANSGYKVIYADPIGRGRKISKALKGRTFSSAHCKAISKAKTGLILSDKARKAIGDASHWHNKKVQSKMSKRRWERYYSSSYLQAKYRKLMRLKRWSRR